MGNAASTKRHTLKRNAIKSKQKSTQHNRYYVLRISQPAMKTVNGRKQSKNDWIRDTNFFDKDRLKRRRKRSAEFRRRIPQTADGISIKWNMVRKGIEIEK